MGLFSGKISGKKRTKGSFSAKERAGVDFVLTKTLEINAESPLAGRLQRAIENWKKLKCEREDLELVIKCLELHLETNKDTTDSVGMDMNRQIESARRKLEAEL